MAASRSCGPAAEEKMVDENITVIDETVAEKAELP